MTDLAKTPDINEVLARRSELLAAGRPFMPEPLEADAIGLHVMMQVDHGGRTVASLTEEWGCAERTMWRWLARGRALAHSPGDVNRYRLLIVTELEHLHELNLEAGDREEARKALMDMGWAVGVVSTGGNAPTVNVGVQFGQMGEDELRQEMREWMRENTVKQIEAVEEQAS